ncbi:putative metal-dependent peptidase [Silvibacterium bohemicum]|uniref:Putative metal-dependent peptidase n=1 Tax=Silvibacterium bohemicum TaxID=1577686 RepID=A0A841JX69_9BACT|nr:VWA-like domain-containing protein [Silvibacterium bohemicum]MBB6144329.1 putative metal-dependent peptidase [Silvibacterium bohemicum]
MRQETAAVKRIQKARTTLLLDHPFFGTLLFRLKGRETSSVKTMATDGVSLFYNPEFVATLSAAELNGVLAHEVLHPGLQHHVRRGNRSAKRWNMACDYAINPLVIDAGLALPKDVLIDNRFRGMSAERIYNLIEEEEDGGGQQQDDDRKSGSEKGQDGRGGDKNEPSAPETPGGFGQVLDAPEAEDADGKNLDEQARDWQIAVEQAQTISKLAGKLPAGLERSLQGAEEARVDWRELLRRAWSETTPSDYSWMRPNRRHIWQGLYLPGVQREGVGEVVIFVDCSGSVNSRQLSLFEAEVRSILEGQRPERVYVVYFDTQVHKVEVYEAGQQISLRPVGGGGTDFRPCFDWVEENHVQPQTAVFLTDLYGTLPEHAPAYPVIWATTGSQHVNFGQIVPMQAA